jgi:septal ring factor EnvC (AmiA/AmiB activator)
MFIPVTLFERYLFRRLSESALAKLDDEILHCCTDYLTEAIQEAQRNAKKGFAELEYQIHGLEVERDFLDGDREDLEAKIVDLENDLLKWKAEFVDCDAEKHDLAKQVAALRSQAVRNRRPTRQRRHRLTRK